MIYAFRCRKCGETFELSESLAEHTKHKEKCPKCGSKDVQQQFGGVQVKTAKKS
ncbi:MAG: zinc ribbon domain-containing protein [Gammaproteobacteria bacterium]